MCTVCVGRGVGLKRSTKRNDNSKTRKVIPSNEIVYRPMYSIFSSDSLINRLELYLHVYLHELKSSRDITINSF